MFLILLVYHVHVHVLRAAMLAQTRVLLPIQTPSLRGPRILLLVNAQTDGKTTASVEVALKRTGGRVRLVTKRSEAEQSIRRWDPEVMILLGWTAASGDWLQRLQFAPHQDDLPFLVVGNGSDHERMDAVVALEAGAQAYIPFSMGPELLTAQVRNILKSASTRALPGLVKWTPSALISCHSGSIY
jgi:two-component system phosphate regulon response regulator PhoB